MEDVTKGRDMIKLSDQEFATLTEYLRRGYGINLSKKRTLIEGRMNHYLIKHGFNDYSTYFKVLFNDPSGSEMSNVINVLTTNYSYFMREWAHFEYYRNTLLPQIKATATDHDIRVWSAGCSTGEEPYTLAMLNNEFFGHESRLWDKRILATDISEKVLNSAQSGIYASEALENVPKVWQMQYFDRLDDGNMQVKQSLKNEVIFRRFNLMEKVFPFKKKFHVIFCRNVMIYFDGKTKNELVNRFYESLEKGGYLLVGHSESVDRATTKFSYVMPSVYKKGQ